MVGNRWIGQGFILHKHICHLHNIRRKARKPGAWTMWEHLHLLSLWCRPCQLEHSDLRIALVYIFGRTSFTSCPICSNADWSLRVSRRDRSPKRHLHSFDFSFGGRHQRSVSSFSRPNFCTVFTRLVLSGSLSPLNKMLFVP